MHEPVLLKEAIYYLHVNKNKKYIDATLGTGGHTLEIVKNGGRVLGIEADPKMLILAKKRLRKTNTKFVLGNFRDISAIAVKKGFNKVDGILFDFGISSIHLDQGERGFSFKDPANPIDMRLNPIVQGLTAADLLNTLRRDQLARLFSEVVNPQKAAKLAKKITEKRKFKPFQTVGDFLEITGGKIPGKKIHPATKPMMALRIAVNSELETIKEALPKAFSLLNKNGRLVAISFHSGEDVLVKSFFRSVSKNGLGNILTKKPITPSIDELSSNPRARSARLRTIEKL